MMAAPPRAKLVQRICGCGHVQYVSKVLKIGFDFFGNNFRLMDLFLGTVLVDGEKQVGLHIPNGHLWSKSISS